MLWIVVIVMIMFSLVVPDLRTIAFDFFGPPVVALAVVGAFYYGWWILCPIIGVIFVISLIAGIYGWATNK